MELLRKALKAIDLNERPRLAFVVSSCFLALLAATWIGLYMAGGQLRWWYYIIGALAIWQTYRDFRRWRQVS